MMTYNHCGDCFWARKVPVKGNNLAQLAELAKKRVCYGAPPQLVTLPAPGGIALQMMRPHVDVTEDACHAFSPLLTI